MAEFVKEFEYQLEDKFKHHAGGAIEEVSFMSVFSPSNKQIKDVLKIKQGIIRAMVNLGNKMGSGKDAGNEVPHVEQSQEKKVFQTLFSMYASDEDMYELTDAFKRILKSGCCKVQGNENFTDAHYESMSEHDFMSLFGRYVHTFLLSRILEAVKA